jgi:TolB-like protein/Tfp pilus assembly protein PilF
MKNGQSFISAVLTELNRRKVLRTVGAYAVAVFVVLQLMDAAVEPLRLPDWLPTLVVIVLILGFPLVFVLAWLFDVTAEGIKKTSSARLLTSAQNTLLFSIMMMATAGLAYVFYGYYSNVFTADPQVTQSVAAVVEREFVAPENSIAVLPFSDLSEDGKQGYFSDGISEEILNLLAQVEGLHVAARTSSFVFRDSDKGIREIGQLLNVGTVLEGSIRKVGDRIRLTAQLINVSDGYHIWSQNYDRELDDVFAIQDEVANAIATALVDSFAGLKQNQASRTQNFAAFEAYRTGRLHWWRRSPDELQKAITLFAEALEHDPSFAPAYAAMADSWLLLALYGNLSNLQATERAMPMIEKALEIDPSSSEAFAALGLARWNIGQLDAAESSFKQAIKLNDDYIPAYLWLGGMLGEQGRLPEQSQVLEQAMALDPLNELLAINYAGNLSSRGDYAAGEALLQSLVALKPDSTTLLRIMSGHAMKSGDLVDAWRYANQSYNLDPRSPVVIETLASAWEKLGFEDKAEELLLNGMDIAGENQNLRMNYFWLLLRQGRLEIANSVLQEQYGDDIDVLPERMQQYYYFQKSLISLIGGDRESARILLEQALNDESDQSWDGDQVFFVTMSSALNGEAGYADVAEQRLSKAEQMVRRARLNGLDDAWIYYTESSIQALRGNATESLDNLQTAYDRGFRELWPLSMDIRLVSVREDPRFIAIQEQIERDLKEARLQIGSFTVASL